MADMQSDHRGSLRSKTTPLRLKRTFRRGQGTRVQRKDAALLFLITMALLSLAFAEHGMGARLDMQSFYAVAERCAPSINKDTLSALVGVESGYNPYAIGVVGGRLSRQPGNMEEALSVTERLEQGGFNYSLGLSQINKYNVAKLGFDMRTIFDPCANLSAGQRVLAECYARAKAKGMEDQEAVRAALSCYYSGNFTTGFKHGYVQAVVARAGKTDTEQPIRIIKSGNTATPKRNSKTITGVLPAKEARRERDPAFVF